MKQKHRRVISYLLSCTLLISGTVLPARAADPFGAQDNTEKVVDAYITVMTMAYPPAGGALAAAKGLMSTLGFFNKPDVVGEAINRINDRLNTIDTRIDSLDKELQDTRNQVFINANLQNTRELRRYRNDIAKVVLDLQAKPTSQNDKAKLVLDAKQICDSILDDKSLWIWSDLALKDHVWNGKTIKAGDMIDPDFKPMPTLEVYTTALATWMAVIEYAGNGDTAYVKRTFSQDLQRHIDFLTVRPGWNELNDRPSTLPEQIQSRVMGYYVPTTRTVPPDRVVTIAEYTRDDMGREIKFVEDLHYTAQSRNEMPTVPANLLKRATAAEEQLEEGYGLDVINLLAQKLSHLRDQGTIREQYIGTFTPTYSSNEIIYTVKPDGTLWWQQDDIGTAPQPNGETKVSHKLSAPKQVDAGWDNSVDILPGGSSTFYKLKSNGDLNWYKHKDYLHGTPGLDGPVTVGTGWNGFTKIIPMGDGVLYGILPDGTLRWNRHNNFKNGEGGYGGWAQPAINVSSGWNKYKTVFGGGNGVIYAVTQDGRLLWFRHDYQNPVAMPPAGTPDRIPNGFGFKSNPVVAAWKRSWQGPKQVGRGWDAFTKLFCAGDGDIYGILPSGELKGYKHLGWENGTYSWGNDFVVDTDWNKFLFAFPSMPSHAPGDVIVVK